MSMSATVERHEPPRPLILSLPMACRTAVEAGTVLAEMNLIRWAESYQCLESDVVEAFEKALWNHTQQPQNSFEEGSDK